MEFLISVAKSGPLRNRGRRPYYISEFTGIRMPFWDKSWNSSLKPQNAHFYDFIVISWELVDFMKKHGNDGDPPK